MSDVTGNIRTCPRVTDIFFCKYCDFDSDCGAQILEMTDEERDAHYKHVFNEFEKWRVTTFPHSSVTKVEKG